MGREPPITFSAALKILGHYERPLVDRLDRRWDAQPRYDDIDLMITGHLTSLAATRRLLLLLGHPGGGKSMLTKVLAARLPAGSYTVVRVSLRQVSANAPIYQQIEQALELVTNGRIKSWSEVSDESADTVRLILLDGLDELLQATDNDRSGYLREVAEFQRIEAAQDRPVMVMVTSRTVVADRVEIPQATPIAKLADFDDGQVGEWLGAWRRVNGGAGPTVEEALAHEQLARQPLLMLTCVIHGDHQSARILGV
jgi:energy-coupling factor transporter ATP-binding protein EcfA2